MNTSGIIFRVSLFGESHGPVVGVTVDGVPPGITLSEQDLMADLSRRRPGAKGTTPRLEKDAPEIISGIFNGFTTGAPLTIITKNAEGRSSDYKRFEGHPRPGHADFTASVKYKGFSDLRGGGHFSGRLTWGLVAAGVVAKKIIAPMHVGSELIAAGGNENIEEAIAKAIESKDSIGGIVECRVKNVIAGLGEPFFYSAESAISSMVFSIPAIKGIEFGSGFKAGEMKGSEHNDMIVDEKGKTSTNNAGGFNGGITNGNEIVFRVAVKPTSSIARPQSTYDFKEKSVRELVVEGRHDACIALRIPPVLEAVVAIVLADLRLLYNSTGNAG